MSSSISSFSDFVFVIVISPKCIVRWFWVAAGLALGICLDSGNKGVEGSSSGGAWKFVWNEWNEGGGGRDGGGKGKLLLLLLSNLLSFRNASDLFCISKSTPGLGALLISSLATSFFQYPVLEAAFRRLDFACQRFKCLQNLAQEDFGIKHFSLSDLTDLLDLSLHND